MRLIPKLNAKWKAFILPTREDGPELKSLLLSLEPVNCFCSPFPDTYSLNQQHQSLYAHINMHFMYTYSHLYNRLNTKSSRSHAEGPHVVSVRHFDHFRPSEFLEKNPIIPFCSSDGEEVCSTVISV